MNSLVITGTVSGEIKTFDTKSGNSVTNFKVFVPTGKNPDGSYKPGLNFKCKAWGKLGKDVVEKYAQEKTRVLVGGEIEEIKTWEANGKSGIDCVVNVNKFELLDRAGNSGGQPAAQEEPAF